jgi:hypothetical protein
MIEQWNIKGELVINCNCEVFCPCVISLGFHPPTEGKCQGWMCLNIEDGHYGDADLTGLKAVVLLDIPGNMSRGGWQVGIYVDENAGEAASEALIKIMSGHAKGTTGLLKVLIAEVLDIRKVPIEFQREGKKRSISVGRYIQGAIEPVQGSDPGQDVVVKNSRYWVGPDIVVGKALKSRVRDFGRAWDFGGRSAELCAVDWSGPERK